MKTRNKYQILVVAALALLVVGSSLPANSQENCTARVIQDRLSKIKIATIRLDFVNIQTYYTSLLSICSVDGDPTNLRAGIKDKCDAACYQELADFYIFTINSKEALGEGQMSYSEDPTAIEFTATQGIGMAEDGINSMMAFISDDTPESNANCTQTADDEDDCFKNDNFYKFIADLVSLKMAKAKLHMYLGDYHYRSVESRFNQYLIATVSNNDDGQQHKDAFLRSAAVDYNQAHQAILNAITDIPANALPSLLSKATDLMYEIELRIEGLGEGLIYPNINPNSVSPLPISTLRQNAAKYIEKVRGLETQITTILTSQKDASANLMELEDSRWHEEKDLAIKSQRLGVLNAEITEATSKSSEIRTQMDSFNQGHLSVKEQLNLEKDIASLELSSEQQIRQIERDEELALQSERMGEIMDRRANLRYEISEQRANTHLYNEIESISQSITDIDADITLTENTLRKMKGDSADLGDVSKLNNELENLQLEKASVEERKAQIESDKLHYATKIIDSLNREKGRILTRIENIESDSQIQADICTTQAKIDEWANSSDQKTLDDLITEDSYLAVLKKAEENNAKEVAKSLENEIKRTKDYLGSFKTSTGAIKSAYHVSEAVIKGIEISSSGKALTASASPVAFESSGMIAGQAFKSAGTFTAKLAIAAAEIDTLTQTGIAIAQHGVAAAADYEQFRLEVERISNNLESLREELTQANFQKSIVDTNLKMRVLELAGEKQAVHDKININTKLQEIQQYNCESNAINIENLKNTTQNQLDSMDRQIQTVLRENSDRATQIRILNNDIKALDNQIANKNSDIYNLNIDIESTEKRLENLFSQKNSAAARLGNLTALQGVISGGDQGLTEIEIAIENMRGLKLDYIYTSSDQQIDDIESMLTNQQGYFEDMKDNLDTQITSNKSFQAKLAEMNKTIGALSTKVTEGSESLLTQLGHSKDAGDNGVNKNIILNQLTVAQMVPGLSDLVDRKRRYLFRANMMLAEYIKKVSLTGEFPLQGLSHYRASADSLTNYLEDIGEPSSMPDIYTVQKIFVDLSDTRILGELNRTGEVYFTTGDLAATSNPYRIYPGSFGSYGKKRLLDMKFVFQRSCDNPSQIPVTLQHMGINLDVSFSIDADLEYFMTSPLKVGSSLHYSEIDPQGPDVVKSLTNHFLNQGEYYTQMKALGEDQSAIILPWAGLSANSLWHLSFPEYITLADSNEESSAYVRYGRVPPPCGDAPQGSDIEPIQQLGVHIWFIGEQNN